MSATKKNIINKTTKIKTAQSSEKTKNNQHSKNIFTNEKISAHNKTNHTAAGESEMSLAQKNNMNWAIGLLKK